MPQILLFFLRCVQGNNILIYLSLYFRATCELKVQGLVGLNKLARTLLLPGRDVKIRRV